MRQRVKAFIEGNIEEIELKRWNEVFEAWYDTTGLAEFWEDDEDFDELLVVLDILNTDKQTITDARAYIIEKHTEDIINDLQHKHYNRSDSWSINWTSVLMNLKSLLGFSRNDIFALIFNEMDMAGVTPDYNNQQFVIEGL